MAGTTSTIPVTIGDTVIQFPNTGSSPIWSEAIIEFVQAVETQLQILSNPFDSPALVQPLTQNINTNLTLTASGSALGFPSASVRSFTFTYAIYRVSDSASDASTGVVTGIYNSDAAIWGLSHEYAGDVQTSGAPWVTFDMNGSDEITLTTVLIPGIYDSVNSTISCSAKTELVTS